MTPEQEEIAQIEEELDGARRDLHETLSAVEAKVGQQVERAEVALKPDRFIRDNFLGAACVAGVLGYMAGSSKYRDVAGAAIAVGLGYALYCALDDARSDDDGRESIDS